MGQELASAPITPGRRRRVVLVVGAGVAGLSAAWHLARSPDPPAVTLLEANEHLGGWISTVDVGALTGRPAQPVDVGPDSLLVRAEGVRRLLDDLALTPLRREPSRAGAYLWVRDGLRRLPRSSVFGVPDSPWRLARSGLVSRRGMLRAAADLVLPHTRLGEDPSIAELLRPRLGAEVFANLVEPMLGGVHAGRAELLSARSAVPEVAALALRERSVLRAVRALGPRTGAGAALTGFDGGMVRLVQALADGARAAGTRVRTGARVASIDPAGDSVASIDPAGDSVAEADGARWRVVLTDGEVLTADVLVLAVPAHVAAPLLRPLAPDAAAAAVRIRYAGVATLTLVYPAERFTGAAALPPGTGFLVPPAQGRLLVGCTWLTSKWPQPSGAGCVVVRAMVGRDGDERWAALDDEGLERVVRAELAEALQRSVTDLAEPLARVVRRMPNALPQYTIGHADRVAAIQEALRCVPGLHLTGAGYRGLGIAACLQDGARVAGEVGASAVPVR